MQEESKEEFLIRHRKEQALNGEQDEFVEEAPDENSITFKSRMKALFFFLLLALFLWMIFLVFGMMKSN